MNLAYHHLHNVIFFHWVRKNPFDVLVHPEGLAERIKFQSQTTELKKSDLLSRCPKSYLFSLKPNVAVLVVFFSSNWSAASHGALSIELCTTVNSRKIEWVGKIAKRGQEGLLKRSEKKDREEKSEPQLWNLQQVMVLTSWAPEYYLPLGQSRHCVRLCVCVCLCVCVWVCVYVFFYFLNFWLS